MIRNEVHPFEFSPDDSADNPPSGPVADSFLDDSFATVYHRRATSGAHSTASGEHNALNLASGVRGATSSRRGDASGARGLQRRVSISQALPIDASGARSPGLQRRVSLSLPIDGSGAWSPQRRGSGTLPSDASGAWAWGSQSRGSASSLPVDASASGVPVWGPPRRGSLSPAASGVLHRDSSGALMATSGPMQRSSSCVVSLPPLLPPIVAPPRQHPHDQVPIARPGEVWHDTAQREQNAYAFFNPKSSKTRLRRRSSGSVVPVILKSAK